MANEADNFIESSSTSWHKELESLLTGKCSKEEVLNVCKKRPLPSYLRNFVWQHCLNLNEKKDPFISFDGLYDLPEQASIKKDCAAIIDKIKHMQHDDSFDDLDNNADKYTNLQADVEAIITLYCKKHNLTYSSEDGWSDLITPLLLCGFLRCDLFNIFEALLTKFIVRKAKTNKCHFIFMRLLLLYHDPQLCTYFDSAKIFPELYASKWFSTLFSYYASPSTTLCILDVYLQQQDPFLVFYLALVILVNARDEILSMDRNDKQAIIDKISLYPHELHADDVEDFCSLAFYYSNKTPSSFGKIYEEILFNKEQPQKQLSPKLNKTENRDSEVKQYLEKSLSSLLCLQTSLEELIENFESSNTATSGDALMITAVDCRSAEYYKRGHLTNAQHLNSHLMLQNPEVFATRVQSLLTTQASDSAEEDVASANVTSFNGEHLCFIGYGDSEADEDTGDNVDGAITMVLSHFLHKQVQYVSVCTGGYTALHNFLISNQKGHYLVGHNIKTCHICNKSKTSKQRPANKATFPALNLPLNEAMISEKFGRLTSAFKVTSGVIKDKVIGIIKNETVSDRHVSSADKLGKGYRNMASVFTIDDDEDDTTHLSTSQNEVKEVVVIDEWLAQYAHVDSVYDCYEITDHPTHPQRPSLLCLNDNHLIVLQKLPDDKTKAILQTKRSLLSILKITSKKKQPEMITIKYGASSCLLASPTHSTTPVSNDTSNNAENSTEVEDLTSDKTKDVDKANESSFEIIDEEKIDEKEQNKDVSGQNDESNKIDVPKEETNFADDKDKIGESSKDNGMEVSKEQEMLNHSTSITAIDRFLIPKAGDATKDIKTHILKLIESFE